MVISYQVFLDRCSFVSICLSLPGHSVPLLLVQLGQALGLDSGLLVLHAVFATVRGRSPATRTQTILG
jgi:hypothetical protein